MTYEKTTIEPLEFLEKSYEFQGKFPENVLRPEDLEGTKCLPQKGNSKGIPFVT